jgi:hypothetical protein
VPLTRASAGRLNLTRQRFRPGSDGVSARGRLAGGLDDAAQVGQQGVAGRFGGGAALGQGAHMVLAG